MRITKSTSWCYCLLQVALPQERLKGDKRHRADNLRSEGGIKFFKGAVADPKIKIIKSNQTQPPSNGATRQCSDSFTPTN
jgi:hypothetical protein